MKVDIKNQNILKKKRFWAGILLAQFVLFYIFSKVEIIIAMNGSFFDWQKSFHQKIFSVFPFSAGDVFYLLLGLGIVYFLFKIFRKRKNKKAWIGFLIFVNALYFVYQVFWGLLYFQPAIIHQLPEKKLSLQEAKNFTLHYLEECKKIRGEVREDKNGVFKMQNQKIIEQEILNNQNKLPKWITLKKGTEINTFKPSLFRGIMSNTGILGYYNPFTAEAQYNPELPSSYLPFTLAHESSHQLGFAREQEANFIGYLIGKNSKNPDLKYSTNYYVLKSLLNSLAEKNPEFVKNVLQQYSPGMKRDRLYEKMFVKKHEGWLDSFFGITNNLFLKSNQQEGSITYSYFLDLLIRYESL